MLDRLLEPDTAMGQYNRIAEAIQSLNISPERCALVESEPRAHPRAAADAGGQTHSVFYMRARMRCQWLVCCTAHPTLVPPTENEVKEVFA
ncbi:MAG: hypothetical protein ACLVJH_04395 [Faecalibacterium prausnitzii]